MKQAISIIGVILTFGAYVPYFLDIIKGKTRPHIYSWSLWGLLTVLIVALQIKGGAGPAIYITAAAGIACLGVVVLSIKNGRKYITLSDTIVATLALIAIAFWLFAEQPVVSMILLTIADVLAFIPTVRKSWNNPHSETLSLFVTNTLRFSLAFVALETINLLSALWIFVWVIANGLFSLMLIIRRKTLTGKKY
jgi:hypothetical protein